MSAQTLLLTADYQPLRVISWQRAITLLSKGRVEVLKEYDGSLRGGTMVIKIPAVVRLLQRFKRFRKEVKFSRINVYGRDNYTCQYCGEKNLVADLTYDHVLPRCQGGKTEWTNIVTACQECNLRKSGRTPEQARMKLLSVPVRPKWVPAITIALSPSLPEAWRDYLYWTSELEP